MKTIFLSLIFLFSLPLKAQSGYSAEARVIFDKLIKAKTEKNETIRGSRGKPDKERVAIIHGALAKYKDVVVPLSYADGDLRDKYRSIASQAEWDQVEKVRTQVGNFLHDESAMEEAGREIKEWYN
ncbi:MAG: hypothetical protein ACJ76H_10340 [Bacteriovoracaceae bacterium]